MNKQIEALKMAVEALYALEYHDNLIEYDAYRVDKDFDLDKVRNACNDALAEAEKQEPVAWMSKMGSFTAIAETKKQLPKGSEPIPLYTHPATWQSLSDDEIELLALDNDVVSVISQVEAKLKEKNQ